MADIDECSTGALDNRSDPLLGCIDRLELLLKEEDAIFRDCPSSLEIRAINQKKLNLLLELDRVQRVMSKENIRLGRKVERLEAVKTMLEVSLNNIKLHLSAANEVALVVKKAIERVEADGTYSRLSRLND